ncbi:hypothetical protein Y032_0011g1422 [Ancylostoma ceylanicum]|nr:hypothetical protein Y032_0011g1422 [Ancylostoma ceylanicum]
MKALANSVCFQRLSVFIGIFSLFTIASVLKISKIRQLLAVLYVIFLVTFLTSIFSFFSITDTSAVAAILWNATTPESLLSLNTYSEAVRLAINSGGVAFFGVMSAASLRNRNGNSYRPFRPYFTYLFNDVLRTYCFVIPTIMALLFVVIYGAIALLEGMC